MSVSEVKIQRLQSDKRVHAALLGLLLRPKPAEKEDQQNPNQLALVVQPPRFIGGLSIAASQEDKVCKS